MFASVVVFTIKKLFRYEFVVVIIITHCVGVLLLLSNVPVDMDTRWQHTFPCIVAGPTGCGKTAFVAHLLRNAAAMIDPSPERITWYYGEWQVAYSNLDIPNMHLEEGLPTSFDQR